MNLLTKSFHFLNFKTVVRSYCQVTNSESYALCEKVESKLRKRSFDEPLITLFSNLHKNKQLPQVEQLPSQEILQQQFGFSLRKDISTIPALRSKNPPEHGIFLQGKALEGQVVALYPGVVYLPGDPIFFPSLVNNFMLRRNDGSSIDGKAKGLSKWLYKSCAYNEVDQYGSPLCDMTWLHLGDLEPPKSSFTIVKNRKSHESLDYLNNPIAVGNYINHRTDDKFPNLMYFEYEFSANFPVELQYLLPNCYFGHTDRSAAKMPTMHAMLLVAIREIKDEELFSDYLFIGKEHVT